MPKLKDSKVTLLHDIPSAILTTKYGRINTSLIPDYEYMAALIAGIEALIKQGKIRAEDYMAP